MEDAEPDQDAAPDRFMKSRFSALPTPHKK